MISKIFLYSFITMMVITVFGLVGRMDYEDELMQHAHYCEMRGIYEQDKNNNVPEEERSGWPNFKPEIQCNDKTSN